MPLKTPVHRLELTEFGYDGEYVDVRAGASNADLREFALLERQRQEYQRDVDRAKEAGEPEPEAPDELRNSTDALLARIVVDCSFKDSGRVDAPAFWGTVDDDLLKAALIAAWVRKRVERRRKLGLDAPDFTGTSGSA